MTTANNGERIGGCTVLCRDGGLRKYPKVVNLLILLLGDAPDVENRFGLVTVLDGSRTVAEVRVRNLRSAKRLRDALRERAVGAQVPRSDNDWQALLEALARSRK